MAASRIAGYWKDTGNVTDMLDASRMVPESLPGQVLGTVGEQTELIGRVSIAAEAEVRGSRVAGPVVIVPRARRLVPGDHSKVQISA